MAKQAELKSLIPPWGVHKLSQEAQHWNFGPLVLWCKRASDELWVAFKYLPYSGNEADQHQVDLDKVSWSRWVVRTGGDEVLFIPVFPDKAVVVKPEYPFRLARDAQARIYVRVPLWIRILDMSQKRNLVTEIPAVVLSKTWFGILTQGEVCYWITTSARRKMEPDPSRPYLAICPIQISNDSNSDLHVEKLALRVELLRLFSFQGQLWSNEMRISYRGNNEVSQLTVRDQPPVEASGGTNVGPPRAVAKKGLAARTFLSIKDLPGLDFLTKQ